MLSIGMIHVLTCHGSFSSQAVPWPWPHIDISEDRGGKKTKIVLKWDVFQEIWQLHAFQLEMSQLSMSIAPGKANVPVERGINSITCPMILSTIRGRMNAYKDGSHVDAASERRLASTILREGIKQKDNKIPLFFASFSVADQPSRTTTNKHKVYFKLN